MYVWMDRWTVRRMDAWIDGGTDGWMDEYHDSERVHYHNRNQNSDQDHDHDHDQEHGQDGNCDHEPETVDGERTLTVELIIAHGALNRRRRAHPHCRADHRPRGSKP